MSLISLPTDGFSRDRVARAARSAGVRLHGNRETAPRNRRGHRVSAWSMVALLAGLMQPHSAVPAADAIEVKLVAEVRHEGESGGRRVARLVPATVLQQGQEVFYTVRILNSSTEPARDVTVVQRIPENTTYVPKSAGGPGAEITFSADGGQSFAREGQLTVTERAAAANPERAAMTRPATPQEYTHIRWHLRHSLAPGAVALARFRAVFR